MCSVPIQTTTCYWTSTRMHRIISLGLALRNKANLLPNTAIGLIVLKETTQQLTRNSYQLLWPCLGAVINIHTDHTNILHLRDLSQRHLWWITYIDEFGPTLHYIKGPIMSSLTCSHVCQCKTPCLWPWWGRETLPCGVRAYCWPHWLSFLIHRWQRIVGVFHTPTSQRMLSQSFSGLKILQ